MASSWPGQIDAFLTNSPYPFVDHVNYEFASDINNIYQAVYALETGIGSGTGSVPGNPLYSAVYNQTYSTVTARISYLESVVGTTGGGLQGDAAVGNYTAVTIGGSTATGSSTGKAAYSGHSHALAADSSTPADVAQTGSAGNTTTPARSNHAHRGVTSLTGGSGITVSGGDGSGHGALTVVNSGVTSIVAGTNITVSGATGAVTINSSSGGGGVTQISAGYGISLAPVGGTGNVTVTVAETTAYALNLSTTVPGGSGAYVNFCSFSLVAGTWMIGGCAQIEDSFAESLNITALIGPTSASSSSAYQTLIGRVGANAGACESLPITFAPIRVILGSTTTVYLEVGNYSGSQAIVAAGASGGTYLSAFRTS